MDQQTPLAQMDRPAIEFPVAPGIHCPVCGFPRAHNRHSGHGLHCETSCLKGSTAQPIAALGTNPGLRQPTLEFARLIKSRTLIEIPGRVGRDRSGIPGRILRRAHRRIYFLADGERVYKWLLAFLPEIQRQKIAVAGEEIASVVGHYVIGQVITSVLCAAYAFGVLIVFRVPNAALLAVLAGIFDVLPLIGFFLFAIPAVAMAFTVSPGTAAIVGALYVAYHLVENYFIVPKVYGHRLKISTLTVLVACLAAGLVAGVLGVILVLPIVASYPILERLWLQPYLESGTVQKHARLTANEHPEK